MNKSSLSPIERHVRSVLKTCFGKASSLKFVVGVSGGRDSMCLLHIFYRLGIDADIVHINYNKRGQESLKDAELVQKMGEKWGFAFHGMSVDSQQAGSDNFQQWAREVRYEAFYAVKAETGADGIAVAHHRSDQLETILQKQFRGAGMASWSAMQVWDGTLFRPLLLVSRNEIDAYVKAKNIPWRQDASNTESDFARNFLRNEWLSRLEQHFPGWQANVERISEQAKTFQAALRWILQQVSDEQHGLRREVFLALDVSLQKALILYAMQQIDASVSASRAELDQIEAIDEMQTGRYIELGSAFELLRDRDYFKLVEAEDDKRPVHIFQKEQVEGQAKVVDGLKLKLAPFEDPDFSNALYLNSSALTWPMTLRPWHDGDRFQPLGMPGHQTVADHLTNRKIAASRKRHALVLESFEETICAVIFPPIKKRALPGTISELARCDASTGQCLIIQRIS